MTTAPNIPSKQPPEDVLRTFTPPPRVHRLNPRAVIVTLGGLGILLAFGLIFTLVDRARLARQQLDKGLLRVNPDALEQGPIGRLPSDYTFAIPPKPVPPAEKVELPEQKPEPPKPPPIDPEMLKRIAALRKEMEEAIDSPVVFGSVRKTRDLAAANRPPQTGGVAGDVTNATEVTPSLRRPSSPYMIQAGTIIPAALVTSINSDLPGHIVGQVINHVYDSIAGRHLLVPQGSRLVGRYDNEVLNGQNRILIIWQRLILPNGNSIVIDPMPGTDAAGVSGIADRVDYHAARLAGATLLSTLIALGGNLAANANQSDEQAAITAQTVAEQASRVGGRFIDRELELKPTITIRAGMPINVLVVKDMKLEPYGDLRRSAWNRTE
jgi:type IV secretion system protein VirB10